MSGTSKTVCQLFPLPLERVRVRAWQRIDRQTLTPALSQPEREKDLRTSPHFLSASHLAVKPSVWNSPASLPSFIAPSTAIDS